MSRSAEDILAKLVSFDTTSRNPNRACIDYIRDYLDGFGVASDIVAGGDGKACLWASIGDSNARGPALAGHTDVVPVDGQNWDSDPFTLTARDGKLFGRGSADMKGFIACALAFVPEFLDAKTSCFHLALTCDEETDMSGAMLLAEWLKIKSIKPDWFWVGEPTGFTIVDQHKGVAAYRTRFIGVPGHSGQPQLGLNAIELAADFMALITAQARQRKDKPFDPSRFDPPYSTFNLGKISGGTAENIIAGACEVLWQVRAHPGDSAAEISSAIERQTRATFAAQLSPFPQAKIESCACFDIPPFLAVADNRGVKTLKKALKCDDTHAVAFATEAGIFQKLGAPAVVCGPGFIAQAHQPNEYIEQSQIAACIDLMRDTLLSS